MRYFLIVLFLAFTTQAHAMTIGAWQNRGINIGAWQADVEPAAPSGERRRIILISYENNIHKHSPDLNARLGDCVPGRKKVFA
jgi:hypothetical protein